MQSLFSLAQLVGGLLCGPLMDVYGARWGMSRAFLSGAAAYGLTAAATSMPLLYLSRVPTAFQHAALAARVHISARTRGPARPPAASPPPPPPRPPHESSALLMRVEQ